MFRWRSYQNWLYTESGEQMQWGLMICKKVWEDAVRPDNLSKAWGRCGAVRWSIKIHQMQCGQIIFRYMQWGQMIFQRRARWSEARWYVKWIRCCEARWPFKGLGQMWWSKMIFQSDQMRVRPDDHSKGSQMQWGQIIFQRGQMQWGQVIFQRAR